MYKDNTTLRTLSIHIHTLHGHITHDKTYTNTWIDPHVHTQAHKYIGEIHVIDISMKKLATEKDHHLLEW